LEKATPSYPNNSSYNNNINLNIESHARIAQILLP